MNYKNKAIPGIILAMFVLVGIFSPWVTLYTGAYRKDNNSIRDITDLSAWNLIKGETKVEIEDSGTKEILETKHIEFSSNYHPLPSLIGAIVLLIGGILTIFYDWSYSFLIRALGGLLTLSGTLWILLEDNWISYRVFQIGALRINPDYRYGIIVSLVIGIIAMIISIIEIGFSEKF